MKEEEEQEQKDTSIMTIVITTIVNSCKYQIYLQIYTSIELTLFTISGSAGEEKRKTTSRCQPQAIRPPTPTSDSVSHQTSPPLLSRIVFFPARIIFTTDINSFTELHSNVSSLS
jgi:hypothetical protein